MNILEQIEKIVKDAPGYYTEGELYVLVNSERNVSVRYFVSCMDILEGLGKLILEENDMGYKEVIWVGLDNPKLEKLVSESVCVE